MELYCTLLLPPRIACVEYVGDYEAGPLGSVESPVKYHAGDARRLTGPVIRVRESGREAV